MITFALQVSILVTLAQGEVGIVNLSVTKSTASSSSKFTEIFQTVHTDG
jgi:hypothetical protein